MRELHCALECTPAILTPYRWPQDSLGGNTKTCMVANVGPADWNFDETMSTLRYANRAKNIKNAPKLNEDPKDAMLREFQEEIARLKKALEEKGQGGGGKAAASGGGGNAPQDKVEAIREQMRWVGMGWVWAFVW